MHAGQVDVLGYVAAALVFASFSMRRIVPLRCVAMASNVAFISYGAFGGITPVLVLHALLLPMNVWRTVEILRLLKRVKREAEGHAVTQWLMPYARSVVYPAGAPIFRMGDPADRLYFVMRGSVRIEEIGVLLGPREVFGEIGMFSANRTRTQSASAFETTELLWVDEGDLALICHQHPGLSLYLIRLVATRLGTDGRRQPEEMIAESVEAPAV